MRIAPTRVSGQTRRRDADEDEDGPDLEGAEPDRLPAPLLEAGSGLEQGLGEVDAPHHGRVGHRPEHDEVDHEPPRRGEERVDQADEEGDEQPDDDRPVAHEP